jgi:Type I phosphodiesterase / nucleotide pyrophosphatase
MPIRKLILPVTIMIAGSISGCAAGGPHRTVLITFDAASDAYVDQLHKANQLTESGYYAQSRQRGFVAEQLTPINIANTGPSHAAIFSGASPAVSGVVGQTFATPTDEFPKGSDAFTYVSEVETIVAAARRQGKRVACVEAPGFDGRAANYTCDYMLSFLQSTQESMVIKLVPEAAEGQLSGQVRSPGLRLTPKQQDTPLPLPIIQNDAKFFVADRNPDDAAQFDTVSVKRADGTVDSIVPGRIYPFQRMEDEARMTNALWLNRLDPVTGEVELYWGQPYKAVANQAMMEAVVNKLGAWPGTLDARGMHAGRISEAGFDALNEYQAKYAIDALALLLKRQDWDLYVGYLPYLDTVQHEYLVTSPLQIDHAKKADRYAAKVKDAYRKLDRWMGDAVRSADATRTNFVVASDHGMIATHTVVAISSLIETWGYSVYSDRPEIGIYTSGASAHIYVNGDDRPGGHIDQKRKIEIIADLEKRLSGLVDNSTAAVFAVVKPNAEIGPLGLRHATNSGDLFVSAAAGFGLETRKPPTSRLVYPISYDRAALAESGLEPAEINFIAEGFFNRSSPGIHGHVAGTPGIAGILYGIGPDIARTSGTNAHMLQITPSIACLLGIAPPASARAQPVNGLCQPSK